MYHLDGALESGHVHQERGAGHQPFLETSQHSAIDSIAIPEIIGINDKLICYAHTGLGQNRSRPETQYLGNYFPKPLKKVSVNAYNFTLNLPFVTDAILLEFDSS